MLTQYNISSLFSSTSRYRRSTFRKLPRRGTPTRYTSWVHQEVNDVYCTPDLQQKESWGVHASHANENKFIVHKTNRTCWVYKEESEFGYSLSFDRSEGLSWPAAWYEKWGNQEVEIDKN